MQQQTFLLRSHNIGGTRLQNTQATILHIKLNLYRSVRCKKIAKKVFYNKITMSMNAMIVFLTINSYSMVNTLPISIVNNILSTVNSCPP
jgi:hypothetical protein